MTSFLVTRTDGIGDLLLSLPVAQAIKEIDPEHRVYYLVSRRACEIALASPFIDDFIVFDEDSAGLGNLLKTRALIRTHQPDIALILRPTFRVALLVALSRIGVRVGTAYRYYSFLFSKRVRQHRKFSDRHETEYNLELLSAVLPVEVKPTLPVIEIDKRHRQAAESRLTQLGLTINEYAIVHPGCKGSALNLSPSRYAEIIDLIEEEIGLPVLVTGTIAERALISEISNTRTKKTLAVLDIECLMELAAIIAGGRVFVSGSTGPMHIAASVGTPTVSFFPPTRSGSPKRWRPLGEHSEIVLPHVPQCPRCIREACPHFNCMDSIANQEIKQRVVRALNRKY